MPEHLLPPITVLTPVYNGARYISTTIESVLHQNYPELEYIVLNDGSTDESEAVLQPFCHLVRLLSHPNMGEARTINRGLALARHDIICIVNADDPVLPGLLEAAGRAFACDPQ